eukprot:scaffold29863_cov60-Isochrysis_galbana.AAC.1
MPRASRMRSECWMGYKEQWRPFPPPPSSYTGARREAARITKRHGISSLPPSPARAAPPRSTHRQVLRHQICRAGQVLICIGRRQQPVDPEPRQPGTEFWREAVRVHVDGLGSFHLFGHRLGQLCRGGVDK